MFGYIKTNKPELLIKDFELYRSVYCGLCKSLGRHYTILSRFSLNYDFTVFAILKIALDENEPCIKPGRCMFNPLARRACCVGNANVDFAADALILSTYHKLRDDVKDSGFWGKIGKGLLLLPYRCFAKKAARRSPEAAEIMQRYIEAQDALEREQCAHLDRITQPTSQMLISLFTLHVEDTALREALTKLADNLGKWIYLIDAVDDLQKDCEKGEYNPIALAYSLSPDEPAAQEAAVRQVELLLNLSITEAVRALETLPMRRFDMILRNILYMGMPLVQKRVLGKYRKEATAES